MQKRSKKLLSGLSRTRRIIFFLVLAGPAQASPETELARRDLAAAQAQADRLADARAQQAAGLRQIEWRVQAATDALAAASAEQARAEAAQASAQTAFATLLPVMLRLSQYPSEAVLAVPIPTGQALQGLVITRGLAITLNRQAGNLRARQDQAEAARAATARDRAALAAEAAAQTARAGEMDRMLAQARDQVSLAEAAGADAARQVAEAAARAATLPDAIVAMDAAADQARARALKEAARAEKHSQPGVAQAARAREAAVTRPEGPALAQSAGRLLVPVSGAVLHGFGSQGEDGPATGMTYAALPGAYVSSPCTGRVAFAAPFRSYGQLIILECGGGYDIVLAGLASIGASPGHAVRPGEPLGRMAQAGPAGPGRPGLYVELRANGRPIDPAPFLKAKL